MVKNLVYNSRNITTEKFLFKNHAENEVRRLVPDLHKALHKVKASGLQLNFNQF